MTYQKVMDKIRYWDNRCARWMMRHFYLIFFEFVLVFIFFIFLFNTLKVIDVFNQVPPENLTQRLLTQETVNTSIIIVLLLLNSFWMLYIFNGMNRLRSILKEISYYLVKRKS